MKTSQMKFEGFFSALSNSVMKGATSYSSEKPLVIYPKHLTVHENKTKQVLPQLNFITCNMRSTNNIQKGSFR